MAGEGDSPNGWIPLSYLFEVPGDGLARPTRRFLRPFREWAQGFGSGRQAPGLAAHAVDIQSLLGVGCREIPYPVADRVDVAFEVAG
jgi:hypothetical protein